MFSTYLLTLLLSTAGAVTLNPIPQGPTDALPIEDGDLYPCDQVAGKLDDYKGLARHHQESMSTFLTQVSDHVRSWYNELSPLEGTTQTLEPGTFQPLQDGATQIETVTNAAYDNYDALQVELDRILTSLQACKVSSSDKPAAP